MRKIAVFLFLISLNSTLVKAQKQYINNYEIKIDSLKILGYDIINGQSDFARLEANGNFKKLLIDILEGENAINYDFSEVENLSTLGSEKTKFKIFTWVVPKTNSSYECFGLLYSWNSNRKHFETIELVDVKNNIQFAENKTLKKGEWWGVIYYEMIIVKSNKRTYYTLLGWDGHNSTSTKKVIDVLSVNSSGKPQFGASLFSGYGRNIKRIIFEYSSNTQMVLRYETQSYIVEKKKIKKSLFNKKKNKKDNRNDSFRAQQREDNNLKQKRKSSTMIIFDRLAPLNPSLKGMYHFYVPETNIVDGFLFINNKWTFIPDIDARNKPSPLDNINKTKRQSKIPKVEN